MKLFSKERNHPAASNILLYYLGPGAAIFLRLSI
ncbi:MAG: hypothetical protein GY739_16815 [Mesoflavibacter sp.]|nr:hypothetical protein [Mesoflavibacter sp.]